MLGNEAADDDTCGIAAEALAQGIFLRGIENKTVKRLGIYFVYICSLFSNTQFTRKQNSLQSRFFIYTIQYTIDLRKSIFPFLNQELFDF